MKALAALLLAAGAAAAEPPPPEYFAGLYERVGRSGTTPPALVNDLVRLAPDGAGGLTLSPCNGKTAIALRYDRFGDVQNLLSTPEGQPWLGCQYFNDMDNYPILACHGGDGSLLTLWPADGAATCATP